MENLARNIKQSKKESIPPSYVSDCERDDTPFLNIKIEHVYNCTLAQTYRGVVHTCIHFCAYKHLCICTDTYLSAKTLYSFKNISCRCKRAESIKCKMKDKPPQPSSNLIKPNKSQVSGYLISASRKSVSRKHMPHSKIFSVSYINAGIYFK